ncbi:MAG: transposase [Pseudomonadota bacterium]
MPKLLREIELKLTVGDDMASAHRSVRISDATYYTWQKRFGGIGRSQLSKMKSREQENARLKKAELELDKLILEESLNHLKIRA